VTTIFIDARMTFFKLATFLVGVSRMTFRLGAKIKYQRFKTEWSVPVAHLHVSAGCCASKPSEHPSIEPKSKVCMIGMTT